MEAKVAEMLKVRVQSIVIITITTITGSDPTLWSRPHASLKNGGRQMPSREGTLWDPSGQLLQGKHVWKLFSCKIGTLKKSQTSHS